jgi:hypothetical protein
MARTSRFMIASWMTAVRIQRQLSDTNTVRTVSTLPCVTIGFFSGGTCLPLRNLRRFTVVVVGRLRLRVPRLGTDRAAKLATLIYPAKPRNGFRGLPSPEFQESGAVAVVDLASAVTPIAPLVPVRCGLV